MNSEERIVVDSGELASPHLFTAPIFFTVEFYGLRRRSLGSGGSRRLRLEGILFLSLLGVFAFFLSKLLNELFLIVFFNCLLVRQLYICMFIFF